MLLVAPSDLYWKVYTWTILDSMRVAMNDVAQINFIGKNL